MVKKKQPGEQTGQKREKNFNVPESEKNVKYRRPDLIPTRASNRYVLYLERQRLVKILVYGYHCSPEIFLDLRHKLLAAILPVFVEVYPQEQQTCKYLIAFLEETDELDRCGGPAYVEDIFGGI
jgi:hypothetical protein